MSEVKEFKFSASFDTSNLEAGIEKLKTVTAETVRDCTAAQKALEDVHGSLLEKSGVAQERLKISSELVNRQLVSGGREMGMNLGVSPAPIAQSLGPIWEGASKLEDLAKKGKAIWDDISNVRKAPAEMEAQFGSIIVGLQAEAAGIKHPESDSEREALYLRISKMVQDAFAQVLGILRDEKNKASLGDQVVLNEKDLDDITKYAEESRTETLRTLERGSPSANSTGSSTEVAKIMMAALQEARRGLNATWQKVDKLSTVDQFEAIRRQVAGKEMGEGESGREYWLTQRFDTAKGKFQTYLSSASALFDVTGSALQEDPSQGKTVPAKGGQRRAEKHIASVVPESEDVGGEVEEMDQSAALKAARSQDSISSNLDFWRAQLLSAGISPELLRSVQKKYEKAVYQVELDTTKAEGEWKSASSPQGELLSQRENETVFVEEAMKRLTQQSASTLAMISPPVPFIGNSGSPLGTQGGVRDLPIRSHRDALAQVAQYRQILQALHQEQVTVSDPGATPELSGLERKRQWQEIETEIQRIIPLLKRAEQAAEATGDKIRKSLTQGMNVAFQQVNQGMNRAIAGMIRGTESFGHAMTQMFGDILVSEAQFVAQFLLQQAEMWMMKKLLGDKAADDTASQKQQNIDVAMSDAAVAGAKALAMTANPAYAALIYGNGMAYASMASFDVGTPYVPRTGVAMIHQGERILTAADNRALMQMMLSGGSSGSDTLNVNHTVNMNGYSDTHFKNQLSRHTDHVFNAVAKAVRKRGN